MTETVLAAMFASLRATVGAQQAQIDGLEAAVMVALGGAQQQANEQQACPHTETEEVGTFGEVERRCVACHQVV